MSNGPILILEDEVLIALDMKLTLEDAGIEDVVVCNSFEQARDFIDEQTPRLAFLDVNIGGDSTGLDVGAKLAARGCDVVIVSGYSGSTVVLPPELRDARRLSKPFSESDLLKIAEAF